MVIIVIIYLKKKKRWKRRRRRRRRREDAPVWWHFYGRCIARGHGRWGLWWIRRWRFGPAPKRPFFRAPLVKVMASISGQSIRIDGEQRLPCRLIMLHFMLKRFIGIDCDWLQFELRQCHSPQLNFYYSCWWGCSYLCGCLLVFEIWLRLCLLLVRWVDCGDSTPCYRILEMYQWEFHQVGICRCSRSNLVS